MPRLADLIQQVKQHDPQLGADLEREFRALSACRAFGLNFERHRPETIELPQRAVRRGDKVRVLPDRGSAVRDSNELWRVTKIEGTGPAKAASIELIGETGQERRVVLADDLVVVAEFRDLIYPGLATVGKVERSGSKPFHSVISGENYHVLKALTYTHQGKIDAIYIDPPYNHRPRDWKYNNDYVEPDDPYRHSKWLAFMERRLLLARRLLNPEDSVLIVTSDEEEVHRLGILLGQIFPEAGIQMVTTVISAKGAVRSGQFSRVEEHLFFVTFGAARVIPWVRNMLDPLRSDGNGRAGIEWLGLRRREPSSVRGSRRNQFYPIFVHEEDGTLHSVGQPIDDDVPRSRVTVPPGTVALWPLKPDGTEMIWGLTPDVLRRNWERGYARVNRWQPAERQGTVQYLPGGTISMIEEGAISVTRHARDGSVIGSAAVEQGTPPPKRVWNLPSHNAETGGTNVLSALIPGRRFPYPKSVYAVEDALRFFVKDKPGALVLDFFAGSGTTAHTVMRLNRQDGGRRQCILVTHNEPDADDQDALREAGLRPGNPEWERHGICEYITRPRIEAAITGRMPGGEPVEGDYKFTDEFPMAEGFEESVEFFTLTYEPSVLIGHNEAFARIAPLLWLRAGSSGQRIDELPQGGWAVADTYGVLADLDQATAFCQAVGNAEDLRIAYVVTDDDRRFQAVVRRLPDSVEPVRLYESYSASFQFATGN